MGNEIVAVDSCFDNLIKEIPGGNRPYILYSTTYNASEKFLEMTGKTGQHISNALIETHCKPFPLQSKTYESNVTNYISLSSAEAWYNMGGYDARLYAGIACEDSCFTRRVRSLPGSLIKICDDAISLHCEHGGMTRYKNPKDISMDFWNKGLAINRAIYDSWDGKPKIENGFPLETFKTLGVGEIITCGY